MVNKVKVNNCTARKGFKDITSPGSYYPVSRLNMEIYKVNTDQKTIYLNSSLREMR